jgi:surface polysaccharide O-acyltransferase-like enzyme
MKLGQKRMFYLDVARVIAIISISLNHAVNRSYRNYSGQMAEFFAIPMASTLFKVLISVFSRIGVPLFLMITGVLILNKKMDDASDVKRFYKHNLLSLFITTEIWYFLMYWFLIIGSNGIRDNGWRSVILGMFSTMLFQNQTTMGSMWYMPMILCVYTTLPFVVMVKDKLSDSKSKLLYLPLGLLFVVAMLLPGINDLLTVLGMERFGTPLAENYLFSFYYIYIIVGYLIGKGTLARLKTATVMLVTTGSFLLCCGYQLWAYSRPADYLVSYSFPLLPVCAGFLFELVRRSAHLAAKAEKPITCISRIAFGIYFVHIVIMTALVEVLDLFIPGLSLWLRLILLEIVSVGLSVAIILPLSKIKIFRKYLFLIK